MLCVRCNNVTIPAYRISDKPLTSEEMEELPYCGKCVKIFRFERVKYVKRPYKIPIDRRV